MATAASAGVPATGLTGEQLWSARGEEKTPFGLRLPRTDGGEGLND
jgi:hypothetical protein